MLKAQYLDLQQSTESQGENGGPAAPAIGAQQFKVSFTRQLDGTISRIEKLIDAANGSGQGSSGKKKNMGPIVVTGNEQKYTLACRNGEEDRLM